MKTIIGIAALLFLLAGFYLHSTDGDRPLTTASVSPSNFAKTVSITKADWRRDGIGGAVAVADFGVRNNNDFPIRIETVACVFRPAQGAAEERTSTTYEILQPREQKSIRNLGFGFIDATLKSECHVKSAPKA
jgi:hypothetical protein